MPDENALFRNLHHLLTLRADIEGQLRRGPLQIKVADDNIAKAELDVEQTRESIKLKSLAAEDKQLQLEEREAKIKKMEANLNGAKSNREYQTLKEQIAADTQANSVLSDEILEVFEAIEAKETELQELIENGKKITSDSEAIKKRILARREVLKVDLAKVESDIKEAETAIAGNDHLQHYRRMVDGQREDGLAAIEGQSCGGCYTMLTPRSLDNLRMGTVIVCTSCSRLLYTPEAG